MAREVRLRATPDVPPGVPRLTQESSFFDAPPEAFGSYRVEGSLRVGAFGPLYRGRDATGLAVVIRVFDHPLTDSQAADVAGHLEALGRFPLNHPAIVPVLGAGVRADRPWMAEPWFDVASLDTLMQRDQRLPVAGILERVTHVAAALDFAAAVGVHHGALHPRDILVSSDTTVVAGLGMVQALNDAGVIIPMEGAYVSPQRASGAQVTAADDVFSLAAVIYELIFGAAVPPRGQLAGPVPHVAGVDGPRLATVLSRALSVEPSARPASALQLAAAIQQCVIPVAAPAPPAVPALNTVSDRSVRPPVPVTPVAHAENEPEIPIRVTIPVPAESDLPLRPEPPSARPGHPPSIPMRAGDAAFADARPNRETAPRLWFAVAATLAIGLLTGFAGGYLAGYRDATQVTASVTRSDARRSEPSDPTATAGRDFTESDVPPTGNAPPVQPQAVDREPAQAPAAPSSASPSGPGTLHVDSRPRGARVFIDGQLFGTTPLVVGDVRPGAHAVRIDLVGHRRWVTTVQIEPGERERVAASLER